MNAFGRQGKEIVVHARLFRPDVCIKVVVEDAISIPGQIDGDRAGIQSGGNEGQFCPFEFKILFRLGLFVGRHRNDEGVFIVPFDRGSGNVEYFVETFVESGNGFRSGMADAVQGTQIAVVVPDIAADDAGFDVRCRFPDQIVVIQNLVIVPPDNVQGGTVQIVQYGFEMVFLVQGDSSCVEKFFQSCRTTPVCYRV